MCWFFPNYKKDPLLKPEITFGELIDKIGSSEVYENTDVDSSTQNALNEFFLLDRLCDTQKKFLWFWRRRLNVYYPIYKQELEMWAERKTEKWFFDNYKSGNVKHDGTFTLDETITDTLNRTIKDVLEQTFGSKSTGKTTGETTADHTGSFSNTSDGRDSSDNNSKDRRFAFNYPESNYSGGVIPYNLDNNPQIEFIDTQADGLKHDEHTGTNHNETTGSDQSNDNGTSKGTSEGTTDSTTKHTVDNTTEQTNNNTRDQDTATHWTEETKKQADNLNKLCDELISQIPTTNFFLKLVDKLAVCFETARIENDEREDLEDD